MKTLKHFFVMVFILLSAVLTTSLLRNGLALYLIIAIPFLFLLFNSVIRSNISFRPYFLSKWNFLSSKVKRVIEFEIPIDLVYERLLEVFSEEPYSLKYANKDQFEIFAITRLSWLSYGENIYISLVPTNDSTIINFDSVALMQVYTWGKNEENFDKVIQKINDSLTV